MKKKNGEGVVSIGQPPHRNHSARTSGSPSLEPPPRVFFDRDRGPHSSNLLESQVLEVARRSDERGGDMGECTVPGFSALRSWCPQNKSWGNSSRGLVLRIHRGSWVATPTLDTTPNNPGTPQCSQAFTT